MQEHDQRGRVAAGRPEVELQGPEAGRGGVRDRPAEVAAAGFERWLYLALQKIGAIPIMALPLHRHREIAQFA